MQKGRGNYSLAQYDRAAKLGSFQFRELRGQLKAEMQRKEGVARQRQEKGAKEMEAAVQFAQSYKMHNLFGHDGRERAHSAFAEYEHKILVRNPSAFGKKLNALQQSMQSLHAMFE